MELKTVVSFNVKMDANGEAIPVNNCTLVFASEDDVFNRAVDSAVIYLQGVLRRNAKKDGNGAITFRDECTSLCGQTYNVPTPGVRHAASPKDVSAKNRAVVLSMREQFPGITSDDLLTFSMSTSDEQKNLMATYAQKYKSAK
jgi:hypothetical protein